MFLRISRLHKAITKKRSGMPIRISCWADSYRRVLRGNENENIGNCKILWKINCHSQKNTLCWRYYSVQKTPKFTGWRTTLPTLTWTSHRDIFEGTDVSFLLQKHFNRAGTIHGVLKAWSLNLEVYGRWKLQQVPLWYCKDSSSAWILYPHKWRWKICWNSEQSKHMSWPWHKALFLFSWTFENCLCMALTY